MQGLQQISYRRLQDLQRILNSSSGSLCTESHFLPAFWEHLGRQNTKRQEIVACLLRKSNPDILFNTAVSLNVDTLKQACTAQNVTDEGIELFD